MPDDKTLPTFPTIIATHGQAIKDNWVDVIVAQTGRRTLDFIDLVTLSSEVSTLLDALIVALEAASHEDVTQPEFNEIVELLQQLSESRALLGFTPSDTARSILSLKDVLLIFFQNEYAQDSARLNTETIAMNKLLDSLSLVTFEHFVRAREALIAQQSLALEHSTPVVSIWEGVLLMPLMGVLDTQRAQQVIEVLLDAIVSTEARVALVDLTAVPAVDTRVALHLIKTVSAAKMLGAKVLVTGISADAAMTLTKLGVDLSELETRGGLLSGVQAAYAALGKEVRDIAH